MPWSEMKLLSLPSLSHVMSCNVAYRVGRSCRRSMGITGNTWSMAHASGSDWKSEKLQKYLSGNMRLTDRSSSGACFMLRTKPSTSRATDQKSFSTMARVRKSIRPSEKRSKASSRIWSASCQSSSNRAWLILSQISYMSRTSSLSSSHTVSTLSSHSGSEVVSSTSTTSTEW